MTSPFFYINTSLGSCLIIIFILFDYIRKYNTDGFQRTLFLAVLSGACIAVATNFIDNLLTGVPGMAAYYTHYAAISLFLMAQNGANYSLIIFMDYFIYNNRARSKRLIALIAGFLFLYLLSVVGNLSFHYYFSISADNVYTPGPLYPLRLTISYLPIPLIIADILRVSKQFKPSQIYLLLFFGALSGIGATLDILLTTSNALWPCFTAALLYIYFFIIQADSRIDSLTGIGNRYSFNEFILNLTKQSTRQSYTIVMIDLDHFKAINDILGHSEGDNALRDMALIIKSSIRSTDFAARYGGDEFILAAKAESNMGIIMERLEEAIKNQNTHRGRPYTLQISYGMDVFTTHSGQSIEDFLAHIDRLMYEHKARRHCQRGEE